MEEILRDWKINSKANEEVNFLFIRSLKMKDGDKIDNLAQQIHDEAFSKINCLDCGNCCKKIKPNLFKSDIVQIAKFLNLSVQEVEIKYLELDEDNDQTFNNLPCPFLGKNNECTIYESRPKDCRQYPHTNKAGFASISQQHSYNTTICPASYYIVQKMKMLSSNF